MVIAGRIAADLREDTATHANVDVVGIGNGVTRRLEELFGYKKAKLYWQLRTRFEQGGIMIPPDEDLTEALSAIKCKAVDSTGKIRIIGKSENLGHSPDQADSLMLTMAKGPEQQEVFVVAGD